VLVVLSNSIKDEKTRHGVMMQEITTQGDKQISRRNVHPYN
jgi:hypothetical protein